MYFFPLWYSYEVLLNLDKEKHAVDGSIYYYVFNTLLYCLLVLHIYWWVLMYRMLVKQIQARGQLSDDVRSGMHEKHVDCMVLCCNVCLDRHSCSMKLRMRKHIWSDFLARNKLSSLRIWPGKFRLNLAYITKQWWVELCKSF